MIEINPQKIDYTQRKSTEEKNPLVKNVIEVVKVI